MLKIAPVLNCYRAIGVPTNVEYLGSAGGLSGAEFWRLETGQGPLVLRRWPSEHPSADQLRFIHAVLEHAQSRGLNGLPVPLRTDEGHSFVTHEGHLWELAPWMPGSADFATDRSPAKLQAAMRLLAEFHRATADFPSVAQTHVHSPGVQRRIAQIEQFLEMRPPGQASTTDLANRLHAAVVACTPAALEFLRPLANAQVKLQPCIRDIWHESVLFTGDTVTGLVDFGAMDWESPAIDVSRLLGSMAENDAALWQSGLAAYKTVCQLSPVEKELVVALDAGGIVVGGMNWLRWLFVEHRQFDDEAKVADRMGALLERLEYFHEHGSPAATIAAGNTRGPSAHSR